MKHLNEWSAAKNTALKELARSAEYLSNGSTLSWSRAIEAKPELAKIVGMTPAQLRKAWSFRKWKYKGICAASGCQKKVHGVTYCKQHAAEHSRKNVLLKQKKRGTL